ncbi:lycopene beta-cyclase [Algoriphagus faecimaris]|uniref:Lycopene beta-cyclase n=1 Tax=Algoriphagus faecimaris TaxID=686796 RepID=A0A1G6V140_9BACT|nr:lycopene cyclase family protein [Algoriphagus faecimaris]SDD46595.1 lycopene beta-cyclase [Algoriphagus faecimaris]
MKEYDFIFAGAGCATLSMVYYILESSLKDSKILLIDPKAGQIPSKTWCYWAEKPLAIHPKLASYSWKNIKLSSPDLEENFSMSNLNYYHLDSFHFFEMVMSKIANKSNIELLASEVVDIVEKGNLAQVSCGDGKQYISKQVFDSRISDESFDQPDVLKQIFAGWVIETDFPVFDKNSITLMEWNHSDSSDFDFFYLLPFQENKALIEYTVYSKSSVSKASLEKQVQSYIESKFPGATYTVTFRETGVIPMTTKINQPKASKYIYPIGTRAGWTKASTGYTFQRIQEESIKIVDHLSQGAPLPLSSQSRRFTFYDNILLNIAHKWPHELVKLFKDLFRKTPTDQLFRFLSEKTSWWEDIQVLYRLNYGIFIKSLIHYEKR